MSKAYLKFKKEGTCIRCGAPRENGKTRCAKHHQDHLKYQQKAKAKALSNGLCRGCLTQPVVTGKTLCPTCLDEMLQRNRANYNFWRAECIKAYGGQCKCCGLPIAKYLQLDHIKGYGDKHRAEIFSSRKGNMYRWAFRNGFPKTLQLLCANCHQAKTSGQKCSEQDHDVMRRVYSSQ